ncbi:MAG: 50S ribosomal protein L29 [Clostridiales bacterium]|nr:50S ribosomal protein L29 [Clostridiales bacterium]
MKVEEIRAKSNEELAAELTSLKEELFKLRFQHSTNQLDNPAQIAFVKKDIARVMTVIRERELTAAK